MNTDHCGAIPATPQESRNEECISIGEGSRGGEQDVRKHARKRDEPANHLWGNPSHPARSVRGEGRGGETRGGEGRGPKRREHASNIDLGPRGAIPTTPVASVASFIVGHRHREVGRTAGAELRFSTSGAQNPPRFRGDSSRVVATESGSHREW
jgi:hypothetical protein